MYYQVVKCLRCKNEATTMIISSKKKVRITDFLLRGQIIILNQIFKSLMEGKNDRP